MWFTSKSLINSPTTEVDIVGISAWITAFFDIRFNRTSELYWKLYDTRIANDVLLLFTFWYGTGYWTTFFSSPFTFRNCSKFMFVCLILVCAFFFFFSVLSRFCSRKKKGGKVKETNRCKKFKCKRFLSIS